MSEALTILDEYRDFMPLDTLIGRHVFYLNCLARRTLRSLVTRDTRRLIAACRLSGRVFSSFAQLAVRPRLFSMRVLYIQYTNPAAYPPLEHSSRILADRGCKVTFLGTGALGADRLSFESHRNIAVRQVPFCRPGLLQKLHYVVYCLWCLTWAIVRRPQWVYASDPLSAPVALLLKWLTGRRVIYHEHDYPSPDTAGAMREHDPPGTDAACATRRVFDTAERSAGRGVPIRDRGRSLTSPHGLELPIE